MLTLSEATFLLGIPRETLRTWRRRGEIVTHHDSQGRVVIERQSLIKRATAWDKLKNAA